tara:strand:+ start:389 stop:1156 length:768 start_codon:yes stop_codon:yes gene_type:complete
MSEADTLATDKRILVWDGALRLFHWLLVATIAVAFLSAEEESVLNQWHMASGWIAAILILFRIVWGFVGGENARFSAMFKGGGLGHHIGEMLRFKPQAVVGHDPLGWMSALLLIAVSLATIWTGALIVTSGGEAGEELHELIGWSLLVLVALHVVAVFIMSALTRENLVRAMITGSKPAGHHPGAGNAHKPSFFAYLVGLTAIIVAVFGIMKTDPQAFVPRSTETVEHEENETNYYKHSGEHEEIEHEDNDERDE